jgi:indole-3-glycerol phosphate synthase
MNYLEKIIREKRKEIRELKILTPYADLEKSTYFELSRPSFKEGLSINEPSIIAEFKRRSPSKGEFKKGADISEVTLGYEAASAAAVSILTDKHFDGKKEDIEKIAGKLSIPVLRKDFIIDEFQILEAKAIGASAILLIASILGKAEILAFYRFACELGLDVLLELHDFEEIEKIPPDLEIVGINNRNLRTFEVDIDHSLRLANELPGNLIKVAESGLNSVNTISKLYGQGFDAFLIGENFMSAGDPAASARKFISELNQMKTTWRKSK